MLFISLSILTGVLAPLIVMTQEVILKYPAPHEGAELPTALSCHLHMAPDIKKLYFTIMGMIFYGITAIVSGAFLACTICKAMKVDLENYFIKDDFKNHVSVILAITWKKRAWIHVSWVQVFTYLREVLGTAACWQIIIVRGVMPTNILLIEGNNIDTSTASYAFKLCQKFTISRTNCCAI